MVKHVWWAVPAAAVLALAGCQAKGGEADPYVSVAGGKFLMGSPEGTGDDDERPVREVSLGGFSMAARPVTQGEWKDLIGGEPSFFDGTNSFDEDWFPVEDEIGFDRNSLPVERVSWYDALVYANKLSMRDALTPAYRIAGSTDPEKWGEVPTAFDAGWNGAEIVEGSTGYRLPTEAQWEYAARGGERSRGFAHAGGDSPDEVGWYLGNSGGRTRPAGTKKPNELGLFDMSGNVWEWCHDWYGDYTEADRDDPEGPPSGMARVLRGGSWSFGAETGRTAYRDWLAPQSRYFFVGFRLVKPARDE
ncbi:MAG: formylglycine-generating enzyme family protein [Treponema sp.]|nr:formylglycine-generating enzyme family protein [Treponema sp.]